MAIDPRRPLTPEERASLHERFDPADNLRRTADLLHHAKAQRDRFARALVIDWDGAPAGTNCPHCEAPPGRHDDGCVVLAAAELVAGGPR